MICKNLLTLSDVVIKVCKHISGGPSLVLVLNCAWLCLRLSTLILVDELVSVAASMSGTLDWPRVIFDVDLINNVL